MHDVFAQRRVAAFISSMVLGCASPAAPPPQGPAPIELEGPESLTAGTSPAPVPRAESETKPALPAALQPCSEQDPTGCKTTSAPREGLDASRKYDVTVRVDDPSLGPPSAPVVAVVFSDFQCPFCARLEPVLAQLRTRYPTQLRVVWKDLPLSSHSYALPAALLAREAYVRQGNARFWEVHDELFVHQSQFSDRWLAAFAAQQKLTWPPSGAYQPRVEQSIEQADNLAIAATPTVFVNGRPVIGAEHVSVYADLIEEELGN